MTGSVLGTGKVGGESLKIYRHRTGGFTSDECDDGDCDSDDGVRDGDSNDGDNDVVRLTMITMVMSQW